MPEVRGHGGGCCGMFHISGFYYRGTIEDRQRELTTAIATCRRQMGGAGNLNRIMEVVLTDRQLEDAGWAPLLRAEGFRPVSRFRNSNSGNICTVFHHHPEPLALDEVPHWNDEPPVIPQPAPRVAPAGGVAAPGNPFVVGQRVRCTQAGETLLVQGNTYTVMAVDGMTVFLDGFVSWYSVNRFAAPVEAVPPVREEFDPVPAAPVDDGRLFQLGQRVRVREDAYLILEHQRGQEGVVTAVETNDRVQPIRGYAVRLDNGQYVGGNENPVLWGRWFEAVEAPADNPVVPEAEPEPAIVRTYYRNVYRTFIGDREFETVEALMAARTGVRRIGIRRFDVLDNGVIDESVVEY